MGLYQPKGEDLTPAQLRSDSRQSAERTETPRNEWLDRQRRYYSEIDSSLLFKNSPWQNYIVDNFLEFPGIDYGVGLEIGAGAGRYSLHLIKRGFNLDISELSPVQTTQFIEELSRHSLAMPEGRRILTSSLECLAEKIDVRYRYIFGFNVLHHLPDLTDAFNHMKALLAPIGRIVSHEPSPYNPLHYIQSAVDPGRRLQEELGMLRCTPSRVLGLMQLAGFRSIRVRMYGLLPPFLVDLPFGLRLDKFLDRINILPFSLAYMLITGSLDPAAECLNHSHSSISLRT